MKAFADLLLSYLLNSIWQVPLLLLTGFVAARLVRPAGPLAEHRVGSAPCFFRQHFRPFR